ncbi:MAG: GTPase HflX [Firmicutes bacterium]|nr:GTPase HflX [Bacillota bacterium]
MRGRLIQNLPVPGRATYIGKGKIEELNRLIEYTEADGILCDDELSPAQLKNLSELTGVKVLDRTMLILDIFADHAKTREGKVQVEIAQLKYRMSRLAGSGTALSRLGGGIGTRGPGEKKIESDRRVIRKRVKILSDEIEEMKRARATTRKKRMTNAVPTVALVGYTNAGKSTILNLLTESDVLSEDKLFATLDPTTRTAVLPDGQEVLFTDTVGFISRLPHDLVDAFRSTLEEAKYADILVHVADASDPMADEQARIVYETLEALGIVGKPVMTVWNKTDLIEEGSILRDFSADASVMISAKNGTGMDSFYNELGRLLRESRVRIEAVIPYAQAAKIAVIRKAGQLLREEYEADGVHIEAYVPKAIADALDQ